MPIYTKTGDEGETSLGSGERISKADVRLHAYGTIDELSAVIAIADSQITDSNNHWAALKKDLLKTQNNLYKISSHLACINTEKLSSLPEISNLDVEFLEKRIDNYTTQLKPLKEFIIPGGSLISVHLHLARTVCRRAERHIVELSKKEGIEPLLEKYINRLSDYLFVVARYANLLNGNDDVFWKK